MPAHFSITQSLWNSSVHQFDWLRLRYPLNEGKFSKISFNIFFGRKFFRCFTLFPIFGWYCCCCCFYCCYIFRVIANSNAFQRLLIRYWMNVLWNVHFFFCSRLDRSAFYSLPEKRKKCWCDDIDCAYVCTTNQNGNIMRNCLRLICYSALYAMAFRPEMRYSKKKAFKSSFMFEMRTWFE